jgi:hypothetical protein
LETAFDTAKKSNPILMANWGLVKDWSEEKRYHLVSEVEAKAIFNAIAEATHGVLSWVQTRW